MPYSQKIVEVFYVHFVHFHIEMSKLANSVWGANI